MSGGRFNYIQHQVDNLATEIEEESQRLPESYQDDVEIKKRFAEAVETLRRGAKMAQRIDWLLSDDDGPETFLRRWKEELE
jgi:hypothetical protein|tara:strand:- start:223 stop:465 length:243 start_codon:yes stop_codon:yes gene_type:complete